MMKCVCRSRNEIISIGLLIYIDGIEKCTRVTYIAFCKLQVEKYFYKFSCELLHFITPDIVCNVIR